MAEILALDTVACLERRGYVSADEAAIARYAEMTTKAPLTIGFELEVLGSAQTDVPKITGIDPVDAFSLAYDEMKTIDAVSVEGDGLYEIISPAARNPASLSVIVRGLQRAGWLPDGTRGVVTAHVTLGERYGSDIIKRYADYLQILRALEMTGATTASRLGGPVVDGIATTWDQGGLLGLCIQQSKDSFPRGRLDRSYERAEFRTLGFYSPDQFSRTLETLFYLGCGLNNRSHTRPRAAYNMFAKEFIEYQKKWDLGFQSDAESIIKASDDNKDTEKREIEYIRSYADHLKAGPDPSIVQATLKAAMNIKTLMGIDGALPPKAAFDDELLTGLS